jgi:hypothetical protein
LARRSNAVQSKGAPPKLENPIFLGGYLPSTRGIHEGNLEGRKVLEMGEDMRAMDRCRTMAVLGREAGERVLRR